MSSDTEAFSFSSEIAVELRKSGWRVVPPNPYILSARETQFPTPNSPIIELDIGIEIRTTSDPQTLEVGKEVVGILNAQGFDAKVDPIIEHHPWSQVWVEVEHRPLGAQGEAKLREQKKIKKHP